MDRSTKLNRDPSGNSLLKQLTDQLAIIWQEKPDNIISQSQRSVTLCSETITLLQENVLQTGFSDKEKEIHFFKSIKPQFHGRLLYYLKIYSLELEKPLGSIENIKAYYQKEFDQIKNFYEENKFWYHYYRAQETYLDEKLFIREPQSTTHVWSIYDINANASFSTGYDSIFSRILSTEWLTEYLHKAMLTLAENTNTQNAKPEITGKHLEWTESKTGLIELIYAFKAIGAFNNGKATIKEISDYLQQLFNVELSNPSRMFQEILRRKGGNTNFLDRLKDGYLKLIDTIEDRSNK